MVRKLALLMVASLPIGASLLAQDSDKLGTIDIYRTGSYTMGGLPLEIDSQVKTKIGPSEHLVFKMRAGEHQIESKFGNRNPIAVVSVVSDQTTYLIFDFHAMSAKALFTMADPSKSVHLSLEHTNAPPDGKYKLKEVSGDEARALEVLPPFHEEVAPAATAQIMPLPEADIREAILQGQHIQDPSTIGLMMEDLQTEYLSGLSDGQHVSGFTLRIYSAKQWAQLQSAIAHREMRPYGENDLTSDMRNQIIHVVAFPSTPENLTGKNMAAADNVERIVLEVGPSKLVMQPLALEPSTVDLNSALRSAQYQGMTATFPQPDISKPFSVVVIGEGTRKTFEIKDKHLSRLK